jgi:hypothetical protein
MWLQVQLAGAAASLLGVGLYNWRLRRLPLRHLMLGGTLAGAGLQVAQLALVCGGVQGAGLDPHAWVLAATVAQDVVTNVSWLAGGRGARSGRVILKTTTRRVMSCQHALNLVFQLGEHAICLLLAV